ncbi:MAG: hypothetical protein K6U89_14770 [Chloroflexi bacterium]|nr:hypothetical protein [Chloroflexota bacterium]
MSRHPDVATSIRRSLQREAPPAALFDFEWVCDLLAPSGLPPALIALLALEVSLGAAPPSPCLRTWLRLLEAATGRERAALHLRAALALDARELVRELLGSTQPTLPTPLEAVQVVLTEGRRAQRWAEALARRRANCLLSAR